MPPTATNLIHRKIEFDGRPTSLRLEPEFWEFLGEIETEKRVYIGRLVSAINSTKGNGVSLASAIRVFVAHHYRGEP
jgi:predicted DNA-binding ribbon-helix-helix protein